MAVASGGFSIREYTANMRTTDGLKTWPFAGEADVEALLPPIAVKKFRWWTDELELVRLAEERPKECGESSKQSYNNANFGSVDIDAEKMEVVLGREREKLDHAAELKIKAKSKAPKKRSIVDIFAVAPHVERLDIDADYEDDSDDTGEEDENSNPRVLALCDVDSKEKKMKTKKKKLKDGTMSNLKKKKKMNKVKKKGSNNGRDCINRLVPSISKKEKTQRLKSVPIINLSRKPNSSVYKGPGEKISDVVSVLKKKCPREKYLSTPKKHKLVQTANKIKHRKSVFRACRILNNHTKGVSGKDSMICNSQIGLTQADKHIRFSDMDNMPGPGGQTFPFMGYSERPNLSRVNSDLIPTSSAKDHTIKMRKYLATTEVERRNEDASVGTQHERVVQPVSEKQASDTCHPDISTLQRPDVGFQRYFSDRLMTGNQVSLQSENLLTFEPSYKDKSRFPTYAFSPSFPDLTKESANPMVNTADILRASSASGRLIKYHSGDPVSTVQSMENVEAFSQPSSSFGTTYGNTQGAAPFSSQNTTVNYDSHALQYQPFPHLSSQELMHSILPFPHWNQRTIVGHEFCGLPLNSQGELIQLNSSGKGMFNQLMRPTTAVTGSSRSLGAVHNLRTNSTMDISNFKDNKYDGGPKMEEQLKAFPSQNIVENPKFSVFPTLGISRSPDTGRAEGLCLDSSRENSLSVYCLDSNMELMNLSHHGKNQVHNQIGDGMSDKQRNPGLVPSHVSQPTMRLMGKEFTVGRSSDDDSHAFEDGKVWTDKKIIAEHHTASTVGDNSLVQRQFLQDMTHHTASTVGDNSLIQRQFVQDVSLHPPSEKLINNAASTTDTLINRSFHRVIPIKSQGFRFSDPFLTSKIDGRYPQVYPAINRDHTSNLHTYLPLAASAPSPPETFSLQEPFIYGYGSLNFNSCAQTLETGPHENISSNFAERKNPQMLPHATRSFEFPFLRPDIGQNGQPSQFQNSSKSLPPWLLSAKQQKETSLSSYTSYFNVGDQLPSCTASGTFFQISPPSQHGPEASCLYNRASSHSKMQSILGPVASSAHPPLMPLNYESMPASFMNQILGERVKLKESMIPRISLKDLDKGKATRKRRANKLEGSARPTKIPNSKFIDCSAKTEPKAMAALLELSIRDKTNSIEYGQTETQTNGVGVAKSGPVKLSAGTKHILKPGSYMNQDISRPTYSTVPFAAGKVSESEEKLAPIYRF